MDMDDAHREAYNALYNSARAAFRAALAVGESEVSRANRPKQDYHHEYILEHAHVLSMHACSVMLHRCYHGYCLGISGFVLHSLVRDCRTLSAGVKVLRTRGSNCTRTLAARRTLAREVFVSALGVYIRMTSLCRRGTFVVISPPPCIALRRVSPHGSMQNRRVNGRLKAEGQAEPDARKKLTATAGVMKCTAVPTLLPHPSSARGSSS